MDKMLSILQEIQLPFAYDHFAEGESPDPPFICYLIQISMTIPMVNRSNSAIEIPISTQRKRKRAVVISRLLRLSFF